MKKKTFSFFKIKYFEMIGHLKISALFKMIPQENYKEIMDSWCKK